MTDTIPMSSRERQTIHPPPNDDPPAQLDVGPAVLVRAIQEANASLLTEQREYFEELLNRQEAHHDAQNQKMGLAFDEAMKTLKMIADQSLENHQAIEHLSLRVAGVERRLESIA